MEHPCDKCGQPVDDGTPFCSHCSAPQIRVVVSGSAAETSTISVSAGDSATALVHPAPAVSSRCPSRVIRWPEGLQAAATAGLVAGLGMTLSALFGIWTFAAGFLSVVLYRHHTGGELLVLWARARLGALSGMLGFALFSLITVPTGFFRLMMSELIEKYAHRSDPQVRALAEMWVELLRTPSGLAAWLICLLLFILLASAFGGAVGGALLKRGGS